MNRNRRTVKDPVVAFVVAALIGVVGTVAPRAARAASSISGPVTQVEYNAGNSSNPVFTLQINGNSSINYTAQQPQGCAAAPALSSDSVKLLYSQAQTALLSGKNTIVYYNVCTFTGGSSVDYIYDIVIQR